MGKAVVDKLKGEFPIDDVWINFEIHPETPKEGMSLAERFDERSIKGMAESLRRMGSEYGIEFGDMKRLSNSRMAIKAGEYAAEKGKFHLFHDKLFYAYFTQGKDIGDMDELLAIADAASLDAAELKDALVNDRYSGVVDENAANAERKGVTGTPTFIINDTYKIVGAQPIDTFRRALKNISPARE